MKYEHDPLLPMLQGEMEKRIAHFKGLSAEEESKLLSLSADQRRVVADLDRKYTLLYIIINLTLGLRMTTFTLLQTSQDSRNDHTQEFRFNSSFYLTYIHYSLSLLNI